MLAQTSDIHVFRMKPLQGDVFNPASTPLLSRVKFRNSVLQRVLELLSLSRPAAGTQPRPHQLPRTRHQPARRGLRRPAFLYRLLREGEGRPLRGEEGRRGRRPAQTGLLRPRRRPSAVHGRRRRSTTSRGGPSGIRRATFIYRLAGRNRQKSASYYTPDVLTQCVVKYALKELLKDKTADQILRSHRLRARPGQRRVLERSPEPACGRLPGTEERRRRIATSSTASIEQEKQKVKAWLADNRVFGVDLNPVAVELAQISLWLNTIYEGHTIPWFGAQLAVGNSLIGARRQVFTREQIVGKRARMA